MSLAYLVAYRRRRHELRSEAWRLGLFVALCVPHWHYHRVANERRSYWGWTGCHVAAAEEPQKAQAT